MLCKKYLSNMKVSRKNTMALVHQTLQEILFQYTKVESMAKQESGAAKYRDYIAETPQRTKVPRVLIGLKGIKKD